MCEDPAQCPTTSPSTLRWALGKRLSDSPKVLYCVGDTAGNCSSAIAISVALPQGSEAKHRGPQAEQGSDGEADVWRSGGGSSMFICGLFIVDAVKERCHAAPPRHGHAGA